MKVELDFDLGKDELQELWCMMANARKGQKKALEEYSESYEPNTLSASLFKAKNMELFIYYSAALGAYVDVLGLAAPEELAPDGSETQKP